MILVSYSTFSKLMYSNPGHWDFITMRAYLWELKLFAIGFAWLMQSQLSFPSAFPCPFVASTCPENSFCGPGSVSTVVLCKKLVAAEFSGAVSAVPTPYFSVKFFCELNEHVVKPFLFVSELAVKFYNCLGFQSSSCSLEPPRTQWRLCCSSWSCQCPAAPPRRPRPRTESPPSSHQVQWMLC